MDMAQLNLLVVNSGSSSLKASLFSKDGSRKDFRYDHLEGQKTAFESLMKAVGEIPDLIGHRFVHGGDVSEPARLVDEKELKRLKNLVPLAPLHLPGNLLGLELCSNFGAPQIACFDTAFHATMPEMSKRLPVPERFGLKRYGFHGLNYAHIAKKLPSILGKEAHGTIIAAHLGSGASLCLMQNLKSVDTSMGYSPAGGVVMGTRGGDLDPGVMLALSGRMSHDELAHMVYHEMGLLALSGGESHEMSDLLKSESAQAKFAVDYFCNAVRSAIGSFAAKAGGIDALVFSGGIGEHAHEVREKICSPLEFLGFSLEEKANRANLQKISAKDSKPVLILPADEEAVIRDLCLQVLNSRPESAQEGFR